MVEILIDYEKCEGVDCAECVDICPMEIYATDGEKIIVTNATICSLCEVCMDVCPNSAVKVENE